MIRREITGPQEQYERSGAASLRDTRPLTVRLSVALMSEFSGLLLFGAAGVIMAAPETVDLIVPAAALYAIWVVTRRLKLPLRLPKSCGRRDWGYPDPKDRRPRRAAGIIHLGNCHLTGRELWLSSDDARQHATIPGTTGAGKTTAILSALANALTHGSGFVLVDGKADNRLYGEVLALARRFGREDDVLVLNFLVASGVKDSNTFNPFATGNADSIRELLASQLGEQSANDANGVFRSRAVALIGTIAPVLAWMRDHKGIAVNIERIRFALELRGIWKLATKRIFEIRDSETGKIEELSVPDIPEDLIYPLQAYLGEIPGYDTSLDYNQQKTDEPFKQHGFALFYFTATFTQLAVSLGHIFRVEHGDIVMRDIVLNRRILVVNLPSLENSDDTLAALGKLVVGSMQGMLAQILGAKLHGEYAEIVENKPGMGAAPFQVVFDEIGYYATSGMDKMLAQARGLNVMFWLSFQDVSGIWARLGEKTKSALGNANLTVAMRQQDADRTRTWLEQTAGQSYVTQATSYHGGGAGEYREAQHAEVRQVSRIDWTDLQRLIEGEAIVLFGGRRIYAKLFYAGVNPDGPMRLARPLMLAAPDPERLRHEIDRICAIATRIETGDVPGVDPEPASATLLTMLSAFGTSVKETRSAAAACAAAVEAAIENPYVGDGITPASRDDENAPLTPFSQMLSRASAVIHGADGDPGDPRDPVDASLLALLVNIELAQGRDPETARRNALATLASRDSALESVGPPIPLFMTEADLCGRIARLTELLSRDARPEEAA